MSRKDAKSRLTRSGELAAELETTIKRVSSVLELEWLDETARDRVQAALRDLEAARARLEDVAEASLEGRA